jgi:hypothetical protein
MAGRAPAKVRSPELSYRNAKHLGGTACPFRTLQPPSSQSSISPPPSPRRLGGRMDHYQFRNSLPTSVLIKAPSRLATAAILTRMAFCGSSNS